MYNSVLTSILTKQHAGMLGWPLKLLNCRRSKVCLTRSMPLRPNGCIFLAFYGPSISDFLAGIPQGLRPSENTGIMLKSVIHTLSHYTCVLMYITFYVVLKTLKNYTLAVKLSKHWVLYIQILRMEMTWTSCWNTNVNENMIIAVKIAI